MTKITSKRYLEPRPKDFPNLTSEGYSEESPPDQGYNCIAWVAGDVSKSWWPNQHGYWPPNIPYETTITAFTMLFEELGYRVCSEVDLEKGYGKVALYALGGDVTHAARQLINGRWTSKLGGYIDIEHTLEGLEGPYYGKVVKILKCEL